MDLLRRNSSTIIQLLGVVLISIGVGLVSVAAGLVVLGSLTLAYGTIREIVATAVTVQASSTEEPTDDGIR